MSPENMDLNFDMPNTSTVIRTQRINSQNNQNNPRSHSRSKTRSRSRERVNSRKKSNLQKYVGISPETSLRTSNDSLLLNFGSSGPSYGPSVQKAKFCGFGGREDPGPSPAPVDDVLDFLINCKVATEQILVKS